MLADRPSAHRLAITTWAVNHHGRWAGKNVGNYKAALKVHGQQLLDRHAINLALMGELIQQQLLNRSPIPITSLYRQRIHPVIGLRRIVEFLDLTGLLDYFVETEDGCSDLSDLALLGLRNDLLAGLLKSIAIWVGLIG